MASTRTFLDSAHGINSLSTRCGTGTRLSTSTEFFCPLIRRNTQGQKPDKNVPTTKRGLSAAWTKADNCQRNCSLRRVQCSVKTYTVEMIHDGVKHLLQVPEDETILSVALHGELDVSYDCKLGVCMTCPAKLERGNVDQSGGMLSDDVIEKGYTLLCVSYPLSDCTISTIPEEELLKLQLATAND